MSVLKAINREIDDRNYRDRHLVLHEGRPAAANALGEIWQGEIEPYLEEYFYDQPEKVELFRWEKLLVGGLSDWS